MRGARRFWINCQKEIHIFLLGFTVTWGCLEPGAAEDLDCGEHGREYQGACKCDQGYIYDGETCISADAGTDYSAQGELDCGSYGAPHAGHCHCDPGYLFDGETCVVPEEVVRLCQNLDGGTQDGGANTTHDACVCPGSGACSCDGDLHEHGGKTYCIPDFHET